MPRHKISVIPGDGVGQEVIPEALRVLDRVAELEYRHFDWGAEYYFRHGRMMPDDGIAQLAQTDAILLGAIGHPGIPDNVTLNGLLLPIRRLFDQYANVRPAILYPGVAGPLASAKPIDMVVVRENTEGEYAQVGGFVYHHQPEEVAIQTGVFTRRGIDRVVRFAFELARKRGGKRRVTSITKSNAQGYAMVLWDRVFAEAAADFPDIETESLLVDAAAMNFVRRPESFDVVVGSNLFGDILSDLSAILTGSIGLAASANLDPTRRHRESAGGDPVRGDDARSSGSQWAKCGARGGGRFARWQDSHSGPGRVELDARSGRCGDRAALIRRSAADEPNVGQYLTFRVARRDFAMDAGRVRALLPAHDMVPLETPSGYILGFSSLRGVEFPVIDLPRKLRIASGAQGREPYIIAVDVASPHGGQIVGFIADRLSDVVTIREHDIREGVLHAHGRPRRVFDPDVLADEWILAGNEK